MFRFVGTRTGAENRDGGVTVSMNKENTDVIFLLIDAFER